MKLVILQQRVENMSMYFSACICITHVLMYVYTYVRVCTYTTMYMNTNRDYLTQHICASIFGKLQSIKAQTLLQTAVYPGNPACVQPEKR